MVVDRSVENQVYNLSTSGATFTSGTSTNYQYAGSTLYLTSTNTTSSGTQGIFSSLAIPAASDVFSLNQTYTIYNYGLANNYTAPNNVTDAVGFINQTALNVTNMTISSASAFIGPYIQAASTFTVNIAPNSYIQFYSNGTNWIITTPSNTDYYNNYSSSSGINLIRANLRKYNNIYYTVALSNGFNITLPQVQPSDVGLEYIIRRGWGGGASSSFAINASSNNPLIVGAGGGTVGGPIVSLTPVGNGAVIRLTAVICAYSGSANVTISASGTTLTINTFNSGLLFFNSVISLNSTTCRVINNPASGAGLGNGANAGTYTVTGYTGSAFTGTATWGNNIMWMVL